MGQLKLRPIFIKSLLCSLGLLFTLTASAEVDYPILRLKLGKYMLSLDAGESITATDIGALISLQPTILWDLPTFRSRIGLHFTADISSEYAMIPISGMGFSGYFYPLGISSAYQHQEDNVVQFKYKASPYVFGGISPLNLSINKVDETNPGRNISFSALLWEINLGVGLDYPLRSNVLLFGEFTYRFASAPSATNNSEPVSYRGMGFMLGFTTIYF
jgi:hypothetical protein